MVQRVQWNSFQCERHPNHRQHDYKILVPENGNFPSENPLRSELSTGLQIHQQLGIFISRGLPESASYSQLRNFRLLSRNLSQDQIHSKTNKSYNRCLLKYRNKSSI